jgi:hypothetical protein
MGRIIKHLHSEAYLKETLNKPESCINRSLDIIPK